MAIGSVFEYELRLTAGMRAQLMGEDIHPELYGTAPMVSHFEWAARQLLLPVLGAGEEGVGYEVQVRHLRPAPIGGTIRLIARVTGYIPTRKITCTTEAWLLRLPDGRLLDAPVLIGQGSVVQRIVSKSRLKDLSPKL